MTTRNVESRDLSQEEWRVLLRDLTRFMLLILLVGCACCFLLGLWIGHATS